MPEWEAMEEVVEEAAVTEEWVAVATATTNSVPEVVAASVSVEVAVATEVVTTVVRKATSPATVPPRRRAARAIAATSLATSHAIAPFRSRPPVRPNRNPQLHRSLVPYGDHQCRSHHNPHQQQIHRLSQLQFLTLM